MNQLETNPNITNFVLFSGGGGLVTRKVAVELKTGENQVTIREVPASFDSETLVIDVQGEATIKEFVVRKPNRKYVDDNLRREGECAQRLIEDSVVLGSRRPEIIDTCEDVLLRTYLDEEVYLVVWLRAESDAKATLSLSYFIDDVRFRWKPTITIEIDESQKTARIRGLIAIENESAKRFDDVEVSFADFTKDMAEDACSTRLEPKDFKKKLKKQRMRMMKIK